MEIIASGRQTGKTSRLIEKCVEAEQNGDMAYIVCHDHAAAREIVRLARELGHIIPYPITYEEMKKSHGMPHRAQLLIDNVDIFIERHTSGHKVAAVTFNTE